MLMKKRYAPPCCTPNRRWTLIELPAPSGEPSVIVPAETVEFKPPLFAALGASSVNP